MRKTLKGSSTIELAIIFPVIVLAIILFVSISIKIFEQTFEHYKMIHHDTIGWQENIPGK